MRIHSRYNTITKKTREDIFEWILYHPNANPSFVSSGAVTVLDP